jgi:thiamine biosynthesis lipoprotein
LIRDAWVALKAALLSIVLVTTEPKNNCAGKKNKHAMPLTNRDHTRKQAGLIVSRLLLVLLFGLQLALLGACQRADERHTLRFPTFGTEMEVTLIGVDAAEANRLLALLREDMEYMHFMWHPWQAGPLGRTNELLSYGGEFSANPSVLPLIDAARRLSPPSDYLFNPAIGKLLALWGLQDPEQRPATPPDPARIRALVAQHPTIDDIEQHAIRMRGTNPALKLDFSAVAAGVALEREAAMLRKQGITRAALRIGNDRKVIGQDRNGPWQHRFALPDRRTPLRLPLRDGESLSITDASHGQITIAGRNYSAILDPRSGYPVDHTRRITVIHPDAATADAAATALFVAGPEAWPAIARRMGIELVMRIGADGRVEFSPALQARLASGDAVSGR